MKYSFPDAPTRNICVRLLSLTLCFAIISATLASSIARTNFGQDGGRLTLPDGQRVVSTGPYVPPALRTDNGNRRSSGQTGRVVAPLTAKRAAPASNLPDLVESRRIRTSPVIGTVPTAGTSSTESTSAVMASDSAAFPQPSLPCSDCDPTGGGGVGGNDPYFGTARLQPVNSTGAPGVTLGSRNFNWSLPLVNLPGRAGLDVSLALYYNSLVWTRQGNAIQYNADHGTPAPGFNLGLPRLQGPFVEALDATNVNAYIMITPSGGRVELRQVSSSVYESADGSYTQLTFSGTTPVVRTTDGTQFTFGTQVVAEWRCTKIEDRNGNYISATYDSSTGHIQTITDTLSRILTFTYYSDGNLNTIDQTWGTTNHSWVKFVYKSITMGFTFTGLTVSGATNGGSQTVIDYVVFPENTSYHFDYNGYGQVYQIRHKAPDGHELEHTFYNIDNPGPQTDCPRFTERHVYAQDWNGESDAITSYAETDGATWTNPETGMTETGTLVQETAPDLTVYKEYSHSSGWDAGLTRLSEFYDATPVKKKWISTTWTQDNTALTYPDNPRVSETNIYDDASNRKRTTIAYAVGFNLPTTVAEYSGSDGLTLLRSTTMSYVSDSAYTNLRIIGLPFERDVNDAGGNIVAKQDYQYDWGGSYFSAQQPGTNFDATNYSASFRIGRGNLSAVRRYDCTSSTSANDASLAIYTQRIGYNLAGETISTADALGHTTNISYSDNFQDSTKNQNTLAYATNVTDPDGYSSTAEYSYDFGAITRTYVPTSGIAPNITYLDVTREYDQLARVTKIKNETNQAFTHFVYDLNGNYIHTDQTIVDLTGANEFHSWQVFDGAGRVRETASDLPGAAVDHFAASYVIYDNMGRAKEWSNPAEVYNWVPTNDDVAGWSYTQQTYDWKGRPLQTTNPDGTTQVITYGGCGCAGGEVTTVSDEHTPSRQRRYTKDSLGRLKTVEEMIWNTGSVYATSSYVYNARDQLQEIHQVDQVTQADVARTFAYDGHGRLKTRTTPEQGPSTYTYWDDDTTKVVTDARLVTTTYSYNNRHQITSLVYDVTHDPTGKTQPTANVSFTYDAAGNRTSMGDGMGSASYSFNNLGQMYSETRNFNGLTPSYTLGYEYNLAGELQKITNPWNVQVTYGYDTAGRLTSVGGANYASVTNYASSIAYRAFGAIKAMNYGDGHSLTTAYDNRLRPTTWNVANVLGYSYQYDGYYHENTGRVIYAQNLSSGGGQTNGLADSSLDRSYEYDNVGRLAISHSGAEARAHVLNGSWGTTNGPYSLGFDYDVWGNLTHRYGWGGEVQGDNANHTPPEQWPTYSGNRRTDFGYDATGNVTNDGTQTFQYDATGQQTSATWTAGSNAPAFTNDPLNPPGQPKTEIKLVHLTELRDAVNGLRKRAGLAAFNNWSPDPNPSSTNPPLVHHDHITQLRTKLEEALNALHLPVGSYAHPGPHTNDPIYAIDFQELRDKIKGAWAALSSAPVIAQSYDGEGLRIKKNEYGAIAYYVRSSVLGGQVIAELDNTGGWSRGYVYSGGNLLAVQQSGVFWMHEDPVTKSQRVTDVNGNVVSLVELDPWGGETNRSSWAAFQPHNFTSYERDSNGSDEAMFRRYNRMHSRFDQPDPTDDSYDFTNPQSLNRYAYVQDDPANFADPTGLFAPACTDSEGNPVKCVDLSDYLFFINSHFTGLTGGGHGGGGSEPQNPTLDKKVGKDSLILNKAIDRVKKRLTGDCLKLFGNIDPSNYLANYVSIGNQTYAGTAFTSNELTFANTLSDTDAKGTRLASGHTVFNQNSAFFTGTVGGQSFPGDVLNNTSSMYGLSLDQIREVAILHELFHVNDVSGAYNDNTGNAQTDLAHTKAINKLIREKCGFP